MAPLLRRGDDQPDRGQRSRSGAPVVQRVGPLARARRLTNSPNTSSASAAGSTPDGRPVAAVVPRVPVAAPAAAPGAAGAGAAAGAERHAPPVWYETYADEEKLLS